MSIGPLDPPEIPQIIAELPIKQVRLPEGHRPNKPPERQRYAYGRRGRSPFGMAIAGVRSSLTCLWRLRSREYTGALRMGNPVVCCKDQVGGRTLVRTAFTRAEKASRILEVERRVPAAKRALERTSFRASGQPVPADIDSSTGR